MVCGSCGRRVDPERSFCTYCGSSVFVDERSAAKIVPSLAVTPAPPTQSVPRRLKLTSPSKPVARTRSSFRVWPLIKLAIFVWIMWYSVRWLLQIPEVRALKDGVQQGQVSDENAQAALDALRARLNTSLGGTPATPPERSQTTGAETVRPTADPPTARPRPPEPPADTLPPGVFLPGNGVTLPGLIREVKPAYTTEARRAGIEGTVLLKCVVRPDGTATDIQVVRSLDAALGLDQQATAAVKQWRFRPGQRMGKPVPVLVYVEVSFTMGPRGDPGAKP